AERWQFCPVLPKVFTTEKVRGLCSHIDSDLAVDNRGGEAVNVIHRQTLVAALPGFSAIRACMNGTKEGAGKHETTRPLEDNGADMQAAERAMTHAPGPVA